MNLAIFDLDNTLIAGDSDYLWGEFLVEQGVVEPAYFAENDRFYQEYKAGRLNIGEFLRFALKPLSEHALDVLQSWREQFITEKIRPILLPAAQDLIERHRAAGDLPLVITATNRFVTEPIVGLYGIEHLIATSPELTDGRYTGDFVGEPCFREGKVKRLAAWLQEHQCSLEGSWFYSDSHNDIPLLSVVTNPVAVDPDETLAAHAQEQGWPVISLR
jgi:HAD superfamily hydrolase (TIGR01490 family)